MENGTYWYDLEMRAPLGLRKGSLELIVCGDYLNGYLTMFARTIPIRDGKRKGNRLSFHGDMKTLMSMIPYEASGALHPSGIELSIRTAKGTYPVTGVLTEVRRS